MHERVVLEMWVHIDYGNGSLNLSHSAGEFFNLTGELALCAVIAAVMTKAHVNIRSLGLAINSIVAGFYVAVEEIIIIIFKKSVHERVILQDLVKFSV